MEFTQPRTEAAAPTLSVVMPNYNHARYLEPALRAHLDQSVPPLEVIVVDDGSTDESCRIVEALAAGAPSLSLIRHPENRGVNAAINRGLTHARGDYVCFSAADDLVTRDFAARSLALVRQHPEAASCFSDAAILLGDSGATRHSPLSLSDRPCYLSPRDMQRFLRRACYHLPSHSMLYRRDRLLELGGFIEELAWLSDWFANYVLAFRHGVCYLPEVLSYFRVSDESYSARGTRNTPVHRALIYRMLDLLESERFCDVRPMFRAAALVPDLRLRTLGWLLQSPRHRRYVTPRLVLRLVSRGAWSSVEHHIPERLGRAVKHVAARARRRRLAALRSRLSRVRTGDPHT